ncbi:MAG: hypothetical protein WBN76_02730, partial [Azonexus sp.]
EKPQLRVRLTGFFSGCNDTGKRWYIQYQPFRAGPDSRKINQPDPGFCLGDAAKHLPWRDESV